jgi:hypothetical protein
LLIKKAFALAHMRARSFRHACWAYSFSLSLGGFNHQAVTISDLRRPRARLLRQALFSGVGTAYEACCEFASAVAFIRLLPVLYQQPQGPGHPLLRVCALAKK